MKADTSGRVVQRASEGVELSAGVETVDHSLGPEFVDAAQIALPSHPTLAVDNREDELPGGLDFDHLLDFASRVAEPATSRVKALDGNRDERVLTVRDREVRRCEAR